MPTVIKRTSPYRGVFVKRTHVHPASTYGSYDKKPDVSIKKQERSLMKIQNEDKRKALFRAEDTDSEYDENNFPMNIEKEKTYKIDDYETLRKKTREERFTPAVCQMFQQQTALKGFNRNVARVAKMQMYKHKIKPPYLHKIALQEVDEVVSEDDSLEEPESDDMSSEDEENLSVLERTPIEMTPPSTPLQSPTLGSPRTPTNVRYPPPLPTPSPSSPIAPISPLAEIPPTPCPCKSLDDIFDENYATLMAIIPVIPLHFRKQIQLWLVKLVSMSDNDTNKINRNQHLAFMLLQLQTLEMTTPFTKDPPPGPLKELGRNSTNTYFKKWLKDAKKISVQEKFRKSCKPLEIAQRLFNQYPIEFLDCQPVPNFGMIAYGACFSSYGQ
ncbi:unnamed protein product [Diamesa tonsa]